MKKMMIALALMLTLSTSANAMNSRQARTEAHQMTEHMTRQLGLMHHQIGRVLDINYDYMKSVGTRHEMRAQQERFMRLERVLTPEQLHRMHKETRHRQPVARTWRDAHHHNGHAAPKPHGHR